MNPITMDSILKGIGFKLKHPHLDKRPDAANFWIKGNCTKSNPTIEVSAIGEDIAVAAYYKKPGIDHGQGVRLQKSNPIDIIKFIDLAIKTINQL